MNLIEELSWRGMVQDIIPGTEEQLKKELTTGYVGFDPTADSLHIGSLVPILLLVHLQKSGHKPIALVGGATGMVGDPSGKSAERNLLDEATLKINQEGIQKQLEKFLDFAPGHETGAELVNNYDWFKNYSFLNFIRDVGKYITVNYMMAKDSVKKRLEGETGMSFTEFSYQLVQGYDFYELYTRRNCKLQMGGSDQWGNIITGTELIRKKAGGAAFAFTCPLITKADGGKFGKTESGNIWLDPQKTSPFEFYQFWIRSETNDAEKWIKIFTFLTKAEIEQLIETNKKKPEDRLLQKKLARELTLFVHGQAALEAAMETTEKLYAGAQAPVESLTAEDLEGLEGIVIIPVDRSIIKEQQDLIRFMVLQKIFSSKGAAKKMLQNGGIRVNQNKITDTNFRVGEELLLHNMYFMILIGKKQHYLFKIR
jgi:tyrosyl-tRNA synthetase